MYLFRLSLLVVLIVLQSPAWSCTKVMRWNEDPPFMFTDPATPEQIQGISVDIARRVLEKLNCKLTLEQMPWARALISLQSGHIDMISSAYNTAERREYAHFSKQALYSPNILYTRADEQGKWGFQSLEDIIPTSFRLGVQINVTYSHEYERLRDQPEFAAHLYENSSRRSLWHMLDLNRIDGVIADKMTGWIELKDLGLDDKIKATPLVISNAPAFFAFSKKNTPIEFVDAFDAEFARLAADGVIAQIEASYLH